MGKINKDNIEDIIGLTPMQEGFLFHYLEKEKMGYYNGLLSIRVSGKIDLLKFEEAWNYVIENNDMLRTIFRWNKLKNPVQITLKKHKVKLDYHDLSNDDDKEFILEKEKECNANYDFNLEEVPFKIDLYKIDETDHVLMISNYHIIYDGWSNGIILQEFFKNYNDLIDNKTLVKYSKVKFKEYVKCQYDQDKTVQGLFWKDYLKDYEGSPRLDIHTEANTSIGGMDNVTVKFPEETVNNMNKFAKLHSTTLATILYSAWAILLQKYTNRNDVVFGTTVSGRSDSSINIDNVVGLFINTIPLRVKNLQNLSCLDLVKNINKDLNDRRKYESTALVDIKEFSGHKYAEELFNNILVIQNYPLNKGIESNSLKIDSYSVLEKTKYNLALGLELFDEITANITFEKKLYDKVTIERILNHFVNCIDFIVKNPLRPIEDITILSNEEENRILHEFNNTNVEFSNDLLLHNFFERRVQKNPSEIALIFKQSKVSYIELNEKADNLAKVLIKKGVTKNKIVGICVERSIEMIVGVLAILKAGGAYLPINTKDPKNRIEYIINDSKLQLVLCEEKYAYLFNENIELIAVNEIKDIVCEEIIKEIGDPLNLAYLIYTSGSTGRPKGVMVNHRAIVNRLTWMQQVFNIGLGDVILHKTTCTFDVSVWELFWWGMYGASVCVLEHNEEKNPEAIVRAIYENKVTLIHFVPSMLNAFLEYVENNDEVYKLRSLKYVISSGETLDINLVKRFNSSLYKTNGTKLFNLYGPTEAAVDVSYFDCSKGYHYNCVPIGKPINNIRLHIVDNNMQLQPIGVPGELCIAGEGLAVGYINNEKLTKEKFVMVGNKINERVYKTGDNARWLPDGNIEFLGRKDYQVKMRGFRIELGEIESLMKKHTLIKESIVSYKEDKLGDKFLVAYYKTNNRNSKFVNGRLRYKLPNNMAIDYLNKNEVTFMYEEIFTKQNYLQYGINIKDGDCVFDIGANIGMFSMFINQIYDDLKVYAFEPIPDIYNVLESNIKLYGKNTHINNYGVSNENKSSIFTFYPKASIMSGCYGDINQDSNLFSNTVFENSIIEGNNQKIVDELKEKLMEDRFIKKEVECKLKTLSNIIKQNKIEQIDLLKIDVEKSELDVLNGIEEFDWKKIKQIVIEVHDIENKIEQITSILKANNFNIFVDFDDSFKDSTLYTVYASKNQLIELEEKDKAKIEVPTLNYEILTNQELTNYLKDFLPEYMIPRYFVELEEIPILQNGKIDRDKLPDPNDIYQVSEKLYIKPEGEIEEKIENIWKEVLGVDKVSIHDNFFDVGGDSLKIIRVYSRLSEVFEKEISITQLFEYTTIETISQYFSENQEFNKFEEDSDKRNDNKPTNSNVAIIGMDGRFPGAKNKKEFWENLKNGVESLKFLSDEELIKLKIDPELISNPHYVKSAGGVLEGKEFFDANFFEYTTKEVEMMDPQIRIFHECAWNAMEDAGYGSDEFRGKVGIYAGMNNNYYWTNIISDNLNKPLEKYKAMILNGSDFLCTMVSYKLNLKGPSMGIQTACSTSLVSVVKAYQDLVNYQCDIALAGGVAVSPIDKIGYMYEEGMILSPDGHCRAFDKNARGTVPGEGCGLVVLKRLEDAIEDRDYIYAVISGAAINNDGDRKVGFTAPSVDGQAAVIKEAQLIAGIKSNEVSYIETHGTATSLGDPVEIAALNKAFNTNEKQFCAIGSVKTNVGHLDSAAGIAGVIKTVLSLENKKLPPSLNYKNPNSKIDFNNSPFYVNSELREWENKGLKLKAGVSSFGIGGTNAHIILEESPIIERNYQEKKWNMIFLSAKTQSALDDMGKNLVEYLKNNDDANLADVEYTLHVGRKSFDYRRVIICSDKNDLVNKIQGNNETKDCSAICENKKQIIFTFTEESNYLKLARELYDNIDSFRVEINKCFDEIRNSKFNSIKNNFVLEIEEGKVSSRSSVFIFKYSLAKFIMKCGLKPTALLGCSSEQYLVGCLAGILNFEDALELSILQGKMNVEKDKEKEYLVEIEKLFKKIKLNKPHTKVISCITEEFITDEEATSVGQWTKSIYEKNSIGDKVKSILSTQEAFIIEFGLDENIKNIIKQKQCNYESILNVCWNSDKNLCGYYQMLNIMGVLWLSNEKINWRVFHNNENRRRIPLPTYPFQRQRYWKEVDNYLANANKILLTNETASDRTNLSEWFYLPSWERSFIETESKESLLADSNWLLFVDEFDIGTKIVEELRKNENNNVVIVKAGNDFNKYNENYYVINPQESEDYKKLFDELYISNKMPSYIMHLWSVTKDNSIDVNINKTYKAQIYGLNSLVNIAQCIGKLGVSKNVRIGIITDNMQQVTGNEVVNPEKSTVLAFTKTCSLEYFNIECRSIDLAECSTRNNTLVRNLIKEMISDFKNIIVAYRGNHRWIQTYKPITLEENKDFNNVIKENGVYIITGGLGGVGFAFAEYLAENFKAKIALLGRSVFPERMDWEKWIEEKGQEDIISNKILKIMEWEKQGAEVLILRVDISDENKMKNTIECIKDKWCGVNGVLHVAGLADYGGFIQHRTKESIEEILKPKVDGTIIINNLLKNQKLDFFVLFSSLGNMNYFLKFAQIGYNAACEYLDAFVHYNNTVNNINTICINWADWKEVGMSLESAGYWAKYLNMSQEEILKAAMTNRDGIEAFTRILRNRFPQVLVSTSDLHYKLKVGPIKLKKMMEMIEVTKKVENNNKVIDINVTKTLEEIKKIVYNIWLSILGVDEIEYDENFFDLGANSLDIIQANSDMKAELGIDIPVVTMYSYSTVESLSKHIKSKFGEQNREKESEEIYGDSSERINKNLDQNKNILKNSISNFKKIR